MNLRGGTCNTLPIFLLKAQGQVGGVDRREEMRSLEATEGGGGTGYACSYEGCDRTPGGPGGILRRLPDISVCMGCIKKKKKKENSAPAHLLFPQQVRPEALAAKAILLGGLQSYCKS